jgi:transcription elongation factor Elf1
MGSSSQFNCSDCGAVYEVVHVEAENVANDHELACLGCGALLQSRQGRFVAEILSPRTFILGGYTAPS